MHVEFGAARRQQIDDPIQPVPLTHESGEAEHQLAGQPETLLCRLAIWQVNEFHRIDAVRNDNDSIRRDARAPGIAGKHFGHRQQGIGASPGDPLGPSRKTPQREPVDGNPFLADRRVDLEQQGNGVVPAEQRSGEKEQIVALVDRIRPMPTKRSPQTP